MNEFTSWFFANLWLVSQQVLWILLFVAVLTKIYRGISAKIIYSVYCILLVRLCIPFYFTFETQEIPDTILFPVVKSVVITNAQSVPSVAFTSEDHAPLEFDDRQAAVLLWLVAVVCGFVYLVMRILWQHRKVQSYERIQSGHLHELVVDLSQEMQLRIPIQLAVSDVGPCVSGIIRPVILLPQQLLTWKAKDLTPILVHELHHIRRRDLLVSTLQNFLQAMYLFHPLVWFLNSQIRKYRELACDEASITTVAKKHYCATMLQIATCKLKMPSWQPALFHHKTFLEKRIKIMLNNTVSKKYSNCIAALFLLMAISTLVAQNQTLDLYRFDISKVLDFTYGQQNYSDKWKERVVKNMLANIPDIKEITYHKAHIEVLCSLESATQIKNVFQQYTERKQMYTCSIFFAETSQQPQQKVQFKSYPSNTQQLQNLRKSLKITNAPRITSFNGQQVNISILEKNSYVEKYEKQTFSKENWVIDPIIGHVQTGINIDLVAVKKPEESSKTHVKFSIHLSELLKFKKAKQLIDDHNLDIQIPDIKSWEHSDEVVLGTLPAIIESTAFPTVESISVENASKSLKMFIFVDFSTAIDGTATTENDE